MRILHRYILKEMLKALALGLAAISGVVCFALVLVALQQKGLGRWPR
jgi:lipopolysaccharide export LptBFGC system permease protein LptF